MKNDVQARLLAEYQGRQQEFRSYADFIRRKGEESKWVAQMEERLRRHRTE